MANNRSGGGKMPTWLIILGFFWGFWPGLIFLGIRIFQEVSLQNNGAARRSDREWEQQVRNASHWSNQRTYQSRTYQPPRTQYTSQRVGQYQQTFAGAGAGAGAAFFAGAAAGAAGAAFFTGAGAAFAPGAGHAFFAGAAHSFCARSPAAGV